MSDSISTRRNQLPWTTLELRTLRELYPDLGPARMSEQLPRRSRSSISSMASLHGVRFLGVRRRTLGRGKKWAASAALDEALARIYQRAAGEKRSVKDLAEETGYPHWWLKRRAARLGLARPLSKAPPWSEDELDLLRRWHGHDLVVIQRKLSEAGFHRTTAAMGVVRKRRGLGPRPAGRYTACELGKLLGVDGSTVAGWCRNGWLEAEQRGTRRSSVQGGDMWWISHAAVREFVASNPHRVDLRKVQDAEWFIDLLAGKAADGRQHHRARPGGLEVAA